MDTFTAGASAPAAPVIVPPGHRVYARHGTAAFNATLDRELRHLSADVRKALGRNLVALVLGGGYGRGEGGVLVTPEAERPYNDLDLFVVVKCARAVPGGALEGVAKRWQERLRVEVDFSRPLSVRDLRRLPRTLMWQDLLCGHVVLHGPADVLRANAPARLQGPLAPLEALRLLLNRGAGLLWAMRVARGFEVPPDADFTRRNYYKCAMALGDAVLISHGRFASSYARRERTLAALAREVPSVAGLGLEGLYVLSLRFKFLPGLLDVAPPGADRLADLARHWGAVLLHVERRRLDRPFPSLSVYGAWSGRRERGLVPVLCHFVRSGGRRLSGPRERLYRDLPDLLGLAEGAESTDPWDARSAQFLAAWRRL